MSNAKNGFMVAVNFDIREFVPKAIWDRFGVKSTWFINPQIPHLAQFYKDFFTKYYKRKYAGKM